MSSSQLGCLVVASQKFWGKFTGTNNPVESKSRGVASTMGFLRKEVIESNRCALTSKVGEGEGR